MAVTATVAYSVKAVGPTTPSNLATAMVAVDLPTSDLEPMGVTLASDTTVPGPVVVRTIVFNLSALFNELFPPGTDQTAMFQNLYTFILSNQLESVVTEFPPVVV